MEGMRSVASQSGSGGRVGRNPWGAVAAATWFESLAVALRPLQRRLAETNLKSD
jgi:hypothetical protein